jgi:hypothetical protein
MRRLDHDPVPPNSGLQLTRASLRSVHAAETWYVDMERPRKFEMGEQVTFLDCSAGLGAGEVDGTRVEVGFIDG